MESNVAAKLFPSRLTSKRKNINRFKPEVWSKLFAKKYS